MPSYIFDDYMSDLRLKNCPECEKYFINKGEKNLMRGFIQPINGKFRAVCMRDACNRITATHQTAEEAIDAWNNDDNDDVEIYRQTKARRRRNLNNTLMLLGVGLNDWLYIGD